MRSRVDDELEGGSNKLGLITMKIIQRYLAGDCGNPTANLRAWVISFEQEELRYRRKVTGDVVEGRSE